MHACMAHSAPTQISAACSDGWVYAIPVDDVDWADAQGNLHLGGRPDCIPASDSEIGPISFGSVDVKIGGSERRVVVYVSCLR